MSKHTPGPWVVCARYVVTPDQDTTICEIPEYLADYTETDEANARLIAAAPDMLEALDDAQHWLGQAWACIEHIKESAPPYEKKAAIEMLKEISRVGETVRKAIAKAGGEP